MTHTVGRDREAAEVQRAYRAASVGRLMLGELFSWDEYLEPDVRDWRALARRELKAARAHVRRTLASEIRKFCDSNFTDMTEQVLCRLYEAVKAGRGLECPRSDFEVRFAPIRNEAARGAPAHSTVVVSLWGLQFWFPEEHLANDLVQALTLASGAMAELDRYYREQHSALRRDQAEIQRGVRSRFFAARSGMLAAFNLLECHLNSVAWEFSRDASALANLSSRGRKVLEDTTGTSIAEKLRRYAVLVSGRDMPRQLSDQIEALLTVLKPFRDSLVHASPFAAPERFGGHDKLRLLYRVDVDTFYGTANLVAEIIDGIDRHISGSANAAEWLQRVRHALADHEVTTPKEWHH